MKRPHLSPSLNNLITQSRRIGSLVHSPAKNREEGRIEEGELVREVSRQTLSWQYKILEIETSRSK